MGFEYALVHLKYTIPPAILLTFLYGPLFTKLDAYKIGFLVSIAVISTIPWDSYLIRNQIWSYPPQVIIGPKLFDIPLEEVFFFVIQTYTTSLIYLVLSKATFQPAYLRVERSKSNPRGSINPQWKFYRLYGQLAFAVILKRGLSMVQKGANGTYMGLIIIWAVPFLLLLWSLAYQLIIDLPCLNSIIPIFIPTLYLWLVDTLALRRGTWVISNGTKLGLHLWPGLEVEEAVFFFVTNSLIVFGQIAFDNALAILAAFPNLFPDASATPSPFDLIRALLKPAASYDEGRLKALKDAVLRLRRKSRSFYLASSTFQGRLRVDLLLLYSFCRVADDLVDNAIDETEAKLRISQLRQYLKVVYGSSTVKASLHDVVRTFPNEIQSALLYLPAARLSQEPLEGLLDGFDIDLEFSNADTQPPIQTVQDLEHYAHKVAGTVARMCIELIFYHYPGQRNEDEKNRIMKAGNRMGVALQYVNIARDIVVDAKIGRVYLPATWLNEESLTFDSIIKNPQGTRVEKLRAKLLELAFKEYEESRAAIERLPVEARGPIRTAVKSYMEIGRVLKQEGYVVKAGRATVPKWRRLLVAWKALVR